MVSTMVVRGLYSFLAVPMRFWLGFLQLDPLDLLPWMRGRRRGGKEKEAEAGEAEEEDAEEAEEEEEEEEEEEDDEEEGELNTKPVFVAAGGGADGMKGGVGGGLRRKARRIRLVQVLSLFS